MKFNFGTGLVLVFSLWACGILYLVYKSSQQNIDLVATDYYNKEIAFQSQIDKEKNVTELSAPVQVNFDNNGNAVSIQFPNDFSSKTISGNIHFFRPDDASKDFDVKISTDAALNQKISAAKMKKGLWRAQMDWSCNGKSFYEEKDFLVN